MVETFLELDEDGEPSATCPDQAYYTATPKPVKKKGKLAKSDNGSLQDESEISNSQIESEDGDSPDESDFETPKALKKVGRTVDYDFAEVADSDRDYVTRSDQDSASSKDESDATEASKKIDLTMVRKTATMVKKTAAGKEKGAFRKEVEARRVLVWKEECNKVC